MIKRNAILFSLVLICFFASCESDTQEINFIGNWATKPNPQNTVLKQYGWGEGETIINFALEIDKKENVKSIRIPIIGGPFEITDISKKKLDLYTLTFYFDRGNFDVTYLIHVNKDKSIWFELETDRELTLLPTGVDNLWYKISGPLSN